MKRSPGRMCNERAASLRRTRTEGAGIFALEGHGKNRKEGRTEMTKAWKRVLALTAAAVLTVSAGAAEYPEGFEEAEMWEEYLAQVMWVSEAEGTPSSSDRKSVL